MPVAVVLVVATIIGCAPRPLLERAIRARGGPLHTLAREGEATIQRVFPGTWRWRTVFMLPDRFAATIVTADELNHFYLFDGATVRAFVGERMVGLDPDPNAPLRTYARFTAVVNLDALRLPGYGVTPLRPNEVPQGAVEGFAVVRAEDGARYVLAFDARGLLVRATGPVDLRPLGQGEVTAQFTDFRRVGAFVLPFDTVYLFGGVPLVHERALAVCPDVQGLGEDSFQLPSRLPACGVETSGAGSYGGTD